MRYESLNSAWIDICSKLVNCHETAPRGLKCKELINYSFTLDNPRNRIISFKDRLTNPFYLVGELLWYLSGSNRLDFIAYYSKFWNRCSDDGETLNSAYGFRLFSSKHPAINFNQVDHIVTLLKNDSYTRQAVLHFKTPSNISTNDEVCTLSMQFLLRDNKLHANTVMRSNDINFGMTYDVYFFTFLQELIAVKLDVELGSYTHFVGSLHLYEKDYELGVKCINSNIRAEITHVHPVITKRFINDIPYLLSFESFLRTQEYVSTANIENCLGTIWTLDMDELTVAFLILLHLKRVESDLSTLERMYQISAEYLPKCYNELLFNLIESRHEHRNN